MRECHLHWTMLQGEIACKVGEKNTRLVWNRFRSQDACRNPQCITTTLLFFVNEYINYLTNHIIWCLLHMQLLTSTGSSSGSNRSSIGLEFHPSLNASLLHSWKMVALASSGYIKYSQCKTTTADCSSHGQTCRSWHKWKNNLPHKW